MTRAGTRDAAEAALCELPSVIGAFVREDVNGHPREVHILVRPGPNPRHLAHDVRDLLEERLGVHVDQRIISIAQLAHGRAPGPMLAARAGFPPASQAAGCNGAATAAGAAELTGVAAATPDATEPRLRFEGVTTDSMDNRVRVHISLGLDDEEIAGDATGLDTPQGRTRAVAAATLNGVNRTCIGLARFEVEQVASVAAFGRDYLLVTVMASSPYLGRRPVALTGAQPVEMDAESAAALATLKAVNRTLSLVLRLPADAAVRPARMQRPRPVDR
jgi:hypothetical protein